MAASDSTDGPARLLSPPPPATSETLPFRINAATRQIHTSLNKLVTARLALAIPPYTSDPILYLHGIHTFAQLYFTFEDSWQDLICAHLSASSPFVPSGSLPSPPPSTETTPFPSPSIHNDKLRTFLATLIPPTLWRTQRLENDILYLSTRFSVALPNANTDPLLEELRAHIISTTADKPHTLLAYSWVLYMAIFSGGRWIRSQLQSAGPVFWRHDALPSPASSLKGKSQSQDQTPPSPGATASPPSPPSNAKTTMEEGMSLFHFDGPNDGEDIKAFFKEKFLQADTLLSEEEKTDVVEEADWIFHACVRLVGGLDERLGTSVLETPEKKGMEGMRGEGEGEGRGRGKREVMRRSQVLVMPEGWVGKAMDPFAAMVAVMVGLGGWYLFYSCGFVGRGLVGV
ncbi:hypothetical protein KVT40_000778 [Elsinoe batatas]|uniref:Heme oxygenase-like protein n=1 Tax=Elsinoe batatas TaxID=2601811 RepID=A0A8K0LBL2_9PEZI|nr:hypothetical protein KVT40_000778 [Elsinoe batatas]